MGSAVAETLARTSLFVSTVDNCELKVCNGQLRVNCKKKIQPRRGPSGRARAWFQPLRSISGIVVVRENLDLQYGERVPLQSFPVVIRLYCARPSAV